MKPKLAGEHLFERDTSRYVVDGVRVPSVTEVLWMTGFVDFSGIPVSQLEAARERGHLAHAAVAEFETLGATLVSDEIQPYLAAYQLFKKQTGFEPELVETPLVSKRHDFAGTLDLFGPLYGDDTLLDLKTSAVVASWVGMQLAGYGVLVRENMPHVARVKRAALRLLPDGTYRLDPFKNVEDRGDFLAALRVTHRHLRTGAWKL